MKINIPHSEVITSVSTKLKSYIPQQKHSVVCQNSEKMIKNALMGLAVLGSAMLLESCEKHNDLFPSDCPLAETKMEHLGGVEEKTNYILQSLNLLPDSSSITDVDSICFSDKQNNRYKLSNPEIISDKELNINLNVTKPSGEVTQKDITLRNGGDNITRFIAGDANSVRNIREDANYDGRFNQKVWNQDKVGYDIEGQYLSRNKGSFEYYEPGKGQETYNKFNIALKPSN